MKTLYFLEPGQKLNDIQPSKRKRALLMSKPEWDSFGEHLVREQRTLEEAEREKEEMEIRKLQSKEMAKTWDNTIVNIRKRRIENRRNQIAQIEKDRRKRFLEMRKEEADDKKRIIEEAQQILRRDKDNTKSLISALRFSEVLREREEQIKFEKKLKDIEDEKEKRYAETIKLDAENYKLELIREKEEEIAKKKKFNEEVRKELVELTQRKEEEEEIEVRLDIQDNLTVLEEIKTIEENERKEMIENENDDLDKMYGRAKKITEALLPQKSKPVHDMKERRKQLFKDDVEENRRLVAEHKAQCKREQEEEDAAIHIHAATKKRIAKIKKEKEKQEAIANQIRREKISEAVAAEVADKEAEENRIIQKAVAEREKREKELIEKKNAYKEDLVRDLRQERIHQLTLVEAEKKKEKELLKLSIMQRFKNNEVNAEFTDKMRQMKRDRLKNNRATWDQQCEEILAVKAAERAEDIDAVARSVACWNLEDTIFLEYADSVLEESRQKSRPLLPMLKYIDQFKKDIGLIARPKQHKIWQSRVPINNKLFECPAARKQNANTPWPSESDKKKETVKMLP